MPLEPEQMKRLGDALAVLDRHPERFEEFSEAEQQGLLAELADMKAKQEYAPIYFFKPNIAQAKLLYSLNDSGEMPRALMLEGSNKLGKTAFMVAWGISMSCGFYPWLQNLNHFYINKCQRMWERIVQGLGFESMEAVQEQFKAVNIKKYKVPNVGLVLGETYTESIDKKLVPEFLHWLPKDWDPVTKKNQQGVINKITMGAGPAKGSMIHFRSYKSQAADFEGIDQDWMGFDEPPPEDIHTASRRGNIVSDARSAYSFTALKEPWMYHNIINKAAYHWQ